jgi:hypothetical protein
LYGYSVRTSHNLEAPLPASTRGLPGGIISKTFSACEKNSFYECENSSG